jgi:hypothetical protein
LLLEDGGCLPPPPVLTHLVDKEYKIYEREINNAEGEAHAGSCMLSGADQQHTSLECLFVQCVLIAEIPEAELRSAVCAGVLEQLTVVLAALLNLSMLRSNQPKMARRGLQVLLKSNTSLYQIIGSRVSDLCEYAVAAAALLCWCTGIAALLSCHFLPVPPFLAAAHRLCLRTGHVLLQDAPTEAEMKLLDMLAAIIQNMVRGRQLSSTRLQDGSSDLL